MRRRLSRRGLRFISRFEGFRACPYKATPSERYLTIGFGHYGPDVKPGQCISERKARRLLRKDARWASAAVNDLVKVKLNQHQHDALVSFTFNLGAGALGSSTLLKELNQGHYYRVPTELRKWVFAGGMKLEGLVRRRNAEARLWRA